MNIKITSQRRIIVSLSLKWILWNRLTINVVFFPLLILENASTNIVQKKKIEGYKKFIMVDGIMICIATDESDTDICWETEKKMLKIAQSFMDNFPDISFNNFGKQSDAIEINWYGLCCFLIVLAILIANFTLVDQIKSGNQNKSGNQECSRKEHAAINIDGYKKFIVVPWWCPPGRLEPLKPIEQPVWTKPAWCHYTHYALRLAKTTIYLKASARQCWVMWKNSSTLCQVVFLFKQHKVLWLRNSKLVEHEATDAHPTRSYSICLLDRQIK